MKMQGQTLSSQSATWCLCGNLFQVQGLHKDHKANATAKIVVESLTEVITQKVGERHPKLQLVELVDDH